ncbi:hypothetical protein CEP48_06145 [Mergibacter septicus]|uniref:Uncharacterized protein n=1 Tax=Mergibacter septicus TaxID=221402 RepID=A0A8E3SA81_9PAST|nr:TIGR04211 family SH3 domain-containing protein [Mergibacter septicus]AWX13788.1 hypothetical protein CEP49_04080 [Mergibacter septicus]AWX15781.1 hypothetical protein CEP47_06145 [Mergibacter septicus]QDJ15034.1 hypothetical protein CEP48_06145 [Mergibacter septicus]UTU47542.1 SH3 domain-containing protein [Mergibacter septicus]WMR95277.1 TIGR04211 family SH3 domain-containing protein [Mergibacter septicus]
MLKSYFSVCLVFLLSLIPVSVVHADETRYISENLSTFLRKGPGDQYRISGLIKAGEPVTVLSQKEKYALIQDSRKREGWILLSDLSSTPSSKNQYLAAQQQIQELTLKLNRLDSDWQQRVAEIQRRMTQAEQQSGELLEQNALLKRQLDTLKNQNRDLEAIVDSEKQELVIRWFVYGGAVLGGGLLLGLILPVIIPRRRRRDQW